MKTRKNFMKTLALLLITVIVLSLAACKNSDLSVAEFSQGNKKNSDMEDNAPSERNGGNDDRARHDREIPEEAEGDWAYNGDDYYREDDLDYRPERRGHVIGGEQSQFPEISAGTLTAGEWRDNRNWDDWVDLFESGQFSRNSVWGNMINRWQLNPTERVSVRVTKGGVVVRNAKVELVNVADDRKQSETILWTARTDHEGMAYLFGRSFVRNSRKHSSADYIRVDSGNLIEVNTDFMEINTGKFAKENFRLSLDLMLVLDTTGSMDDELRYLQAELEDVVNEVKRGKSNLPVRLSVNFYRDHGDDYVVLPYEFTTDIRKANIILGEQSAAGGGDWPEALDEALINAVFEHDWKEDSVKVMLLVLDAPAHNRHDAIRNLQEAIEGAARKGIRIIPVMASGNGSDYDLDTEFLLRTFAVMTGGTFTFLTDHSGVGNTHAEPTIGAYQVEKLNEALIRIMNEYLT